MLFYTVGQSQVFLAMVYAGLMIGALYDAMRVVRRFLTAGPILTLAADLVFGAGSAVFFIAFMLKANYGDLRFFMLLGAACGLTLYALTLGPLLRRIGSVLAKWGKSLFCHISETKLIKRILK